MKTSTPLSPPKTERVSGRCCEDRMQNPEISPKFWKSNYMIQNPENPTNLVSVEFQISNWYKLKTRWSIRSWKRLCKINLLSLNLASIRPRTSLRKFPKSDIVSAEGSETSRRGCIMEQQLTLTRVERCTLCEIERWNALGGSPKLIEANSVYRAKLIAENSV